MNRTVFHPMFRQPALLCGLIVAAFALTTVARGDGLKFDAPPASTGGGLKVDTNPPDTKPDAKVFVKPINWYPTYLQACNEARKSDKLIIAYFCGSDWDEWTKKLDKEVLKTDMFRDWAEKNVILLKFDMLKFSGSASARETIEKYKLKYNITKVPTFLFLDCDGFLINRCGYDKAALREDEDKGKPAAWIKYCEEVVKTRPPRATVNEQKTFDAALKESKKHYVPIVMLISNSDIPMYTQLKADLLKNQPFVAFVNQNFVFTQTKFPSDADQTPEAVKFRAFVEANKISPSTKMQLVIYDHFVPAGKPNVQARFPVSTTYIQDVDPLIEKLDQNVANPDYSGDWLTDWKQAQFVSNRLKRPMLIYFTQDTSEPCQKFDTEVFSTQEFKRYVKKSLVLMRAEYPKDPAHIKEQTDEVKEQNRALADQFAIRGYPTVIVRNFLGQRIADSGYMKGGAQSFVDQIEGVLKEDRNTRPLALQK